MPFLLNIDTKEIKNDHVDVKAHEVIVLLLIPDFAKICQQSGTEFHFPDLDKQLCLIQQTFERRERTKSTASNRQQQAAADIALRPTTLNTGRLE